MSRHCQLDRDAGMSAGTDRELFCRVARRFSVPQEFALACPSIVSPGTPGVAGTPDRSLASLCHSRCHITRKNNRQPHLINSPSLHCRHGRLTLLPWSTMTTNHRAYKDREEEEEERRSKRRGGRGGRGGGRGGRGGGRGG